jgi:hypothetical protein
MRSKIRCDGKSENFGKIFGMYGAQGPRKEGVEANIGTWPYYYFLDTIW